jgi:hypothetical protein
VGSPSFPTGNAVTTGTNANIPRTDPATGAGQIASEPNSSNVASGATPSGMGSSGHTPAGC